MKFFRSIILSCILFSGVLMVAPAHAAGETAVKGQISTVDLTNPIGGTASNKTGEIRIKVIVGNIIKQALTILGSITFVVFLVGGAYWLTSAGNAERVKKGSQTMVWAAIGLFVVFAAYGILAALIGGLTGRALVDNSPAGGTSSGIVSGDSSSAAATYYKAGAADVKVWADAKENVVLKATIAKTTPCIESSGKEKDGYTEVTDPKSKAVGWAKSSDISPATDKNCGGPGANTAEVEQTKCQIQKGDTHVCRDTKGMSQPKKDALGCEPNLCKNSTLMKQFPNEVKKKSDGNSWKCCLPEESAADAASEYTSCDCKLEVDGPGSCNYLKVHTFSIGEKINTKQFVNLPKMDMTCVGISAAGYVSDFVDDGTLEANTVMTDELCNWAGSQKDGISGIIDYEVTCELK